MEMISASKKKYSSWKKSSEISPNSLVLLRNNLHPVIGLIHRNGNFFFLFFFFSQLLVFRYNRTELIIIVSDMLSMAKFYLFT